MAELMQPVTYDDNGANGYIELDLQPYLNGHLSYSVPNPDGNQVQVMRGVSKRYRVEFFEWRYDDLELHVKLYHEGGSAQYYDIAALEDAQDYLLVTDAAPTDLTIRDGSTTVNAAAPSNYHVGSGSSRKIGQRWHQSVLTDSAAYDEIQVPSGVNVWIYKWVKRTHYRDTRDTYALKAGMSTELRLLPLAAPATPTGLAATPDSDTEVTVTWTDASSNETGFVLERSLDQTTWAEVATLAAGATSYGDTGLSAGTTYYYRVKAVAGAKASSWSNTASVTTYTPIVLTVQTDNAGVSSSTQFAIPLVSTGTYDFFVQWGDGSTSGQITTYNDAELTHTYSSAGSKT
ncbi:MAG: fibronectin type III domain-containing protein, partial [Epibacterium sp.]|nr:fibronectin type III domain-containing protein [Epibacterium sp.]NQX74242.1 fibronectin type III domain-containing protein [Epibacterium sp.]